MKKLITILVLCSLLSSCIEADITPLLKSNGSKGENEPEQAAIWSHGLDYKSSRATRLYTFQESLISIIEFNEGFVVQANSLDSGKQIWKQTNVGKCTPSSASDCQLFENILVLSDYSYTLAIDANTGEILWRDFQSNGSDEISVIDGKVIKMASNTGWCEAYEINIKTGAKNLLFRRTKENNQQYSPEYYAPTKAKLANGDVVYLFYGRSIKNQSEKQLEVMAFNMDGLKVEWVKYLGPEYHRSKMIVIDSKFYLTSINNMYCLNVETGEHCWKTPISFRCEDYVISDERIFLNSGEVLKLSNGKKIREEEFLSLGYSLNENKDFVIASSSSISILDKQSLELYKYGEYFGWYVLPHPTKNQLYVTKNGTLFCLAIDRMK